LDFFESIDFGLDPWTNWIDSGGRSDAFPYGLVLFSLLSIVFLLSKVTFVVFGSLSFVWLFAFLVIICDLIMVQVISKHKDIKSSLIYFFSPLVLYVNVFYLQTDVFVGLFMILFAISLLQRKGKFAGIFLGLGIGSKFGVLIVIPFLVIYALFNSRVRKKIYQTLTWCTLIGSISYLPTLYSRGFREMVFGTREVFNLFVLNLSLGNENLYLFPATYVFLCVWIYKRSRSGLRTAIGFTGASLISLALFSESAVGWFLWGVPILIYLGIFSKVGKGISFNTVQIAIILSDLFTGKLDSLDYRIIDIDPIFANTLFTVALVLSGMWAFSVLSETIRMSDDINLVTKPISLAIAGDSGVGKDTLVDSISDILGEQVITVVSGDGYHKHERGHKKWSVATHLNPDENFIEEWQKDFSNAILGEDVQAKTYDHRNGRFQYLNRAKSRDVVVSQGLHALYQNEKSEVDLKIFLELREDLRLQFKEQRDSTVRNHSKSDNLDERKRRKTDYIKYIEFQKKSADLYVFQTSTKQNSTRVDQVVVEIQSPALLDFLYLSFLPFVRHCEVINVGNNKRALLFNFVDQIEAIALMGALTRGSKVLLDYFPEAKYPRVGSMGLISALTLLSVKYKRSKSN
jgi:uridine kinase